MLFSKYCENNYLKNNFLFHKDPALFPNDKCLIFCLFVCLEIMTKPDRHVGGDLALSSGFHSLAPAEAASLCSKESPPSRVALWGEGTN